MKLTQPTMISKIRFMWFPWLLYFTLALPAFHGLYVKDPKKVILSATYSNVHRGLLDCFCSPSSSGAGISAMMKVDGALKHINAAIAQLIKNGTSKEQAIQLMKSNATREFNLCFDKYNYMSCINADMLLRFKYKFSMCTFDNDSMKNLVPVETASIRKSQTKTNTLESTGFCPRRTFDKNPQRLMLRSSRMRRGYLWCSCSPHRSVSPKERKTVSEALGRLAEKRSFSKHGDTGLLSIKDSRLRKAAEEELFACSKKFSYSKCINADAALRGAGNESLCSWDSRTLRNIGPEFFGKPDTLVTLGKCRTSRLSKVYGSSFDSRGGHQLRAKGSANEGCVAVHHLSGYVLQHRTNLIRPVLCSRGFCATPNHAILLRGVLTSMRNLCGSSEWKCVNALMPVNNLKVTVNRRARFSNDIIITPYDIRFPKFATWIVQILENVLEVSLMTLNVFCFASFLVFIIDRAVKYLYMPTKRHNL